MRTSFLLPVTALMAIAAGCGSDIKEQASSSVLQRDLTLVTQTPEVEIASPVEMQQPRPAARLARAPRSRHLEPKVKPADLWTPRPIPAASQPTAQPVSTTPTPQPVNDRELLPGKTVTLIPASSGPSAGPDKADGLPEGRGRTMVVGGGGGGRCGGGGRGRGPGIGAAPRPDFR